MSNFSFLTLNIENPSLERARRQCLWLLGRPESVFVLTETKNSAGCSYIRDYFAHQVCDLHGRPVRFYINYPQAPGKELGVMIISRFPIKGNASPLKSSDSFFGRYAESSLMVGNIDICLLGLYVPSRDRSSPKIKRKQQFLSFAQGRIQNRLLEKNILLGDFNILDRHHLPHYSTFFEWEYRFYDFLLDKGYVDAFRNLHPNENDYSWVGRTGDGYRYDYAFVSRDLATKVSSCHFLHETRNKGLSDHSAITFDIDL
jgi:exodeoxyribonuclease-3